MKFKDLKSTGSLSDLKALFINKSERTPKHQRNQRSMTIAPGYIHPRTKEIIPPLLVRTVDCYGCGRRNNSPFIKLNIGKGVYAHNEAACKSKAMRRMLEEKTEKTEKTESDVSGE